MPRHQHTLALLIGGDPDHAHLIRKLLTETPGATFALEWADSLEAGLKRIGQGTVDLVLLELALPGSAGLDTLRRFRAAAPPSLPVIVIAPQGEENLGLQALHTGAQDYLVQGQIDSALLARSLRYARERACNIHAEAALWESTQMLRLVLDTIPGFVFWKDRNSVYLGCNQRFAANAGLSAPADIVGLTDLDLPWKHAEGEAYRADDRQVMESGVPKLYYEETQLTADGRLTDVRTSKIPLRDPQGQVIGVLGAFEDFTEQKRAQRMLAEAEAKYRCLVEESLVGVYVIQQARFVYVNACWTRMFGYRADEIIGHPIEETVAPEDRALVLEKIRQRETGSTQRARFTFRGLRKDGRIIDVEVLGSRTIFNGQPAVIGSALDITARKRTEEAMHRLNRELRAISDCNQTLLRATDEQALLHEICRIICDEAGYRMAWVGYAEHDAAKTIRPVARGGVEDGYLAATQATWADTQCGQRPAGAAIRTGQTVCMQDLASDPQALPWRELAMQRGYRSTIALPLKDERGHTHGVLVIYAAIPSAFTPAEVRLLEELAGDLAFGLSALRTRAEREQAEKSLRQAKDAADAANKTKDQFLAVLSHELRTPLTPVLATVTALEAQADLPTEVREDMQLIRRNVTLETRLIDDLLDFTRLTRGKIQLHHEIVDAHACLNAALQICQAEIQAKPLTVSMQLEADEHQVWADPTRLQQVFWNLIQNAAKFTPPHGSIHLRSRNEDGRIRIQVRDTGIGIEPAMLPRIFDAFVQAEQTKARRFGGLGMGLTIARNIMDLHHGQLTAFSEGTDKGAAFTVELPALSSQPITTAPPPPAPTPQRQPQHRILLVDDNADTLRVLSRLLRLCGYTVTPADSVRNALQCAATQPFDLLISDIGLTDGSGLDIMRHVKQAYGLRGIAISGYGQDEDIRQSRAAGFDLHLTKPVSFDALQSAVRQFIGA